MFRSVLPAFLGLSLIATAVSAQNIPPAVPIPAIPAPAPIQTPTEAQGALHALHAPCAMTEDETSCARALACIEQTGVWFAGRATGRGTGVLSGAFSDGRRCTGTWTSRNLLGLGQAEISCSDGTTGIALYTYQDAWTGTATGRGQLSDGRTFRVWSGAHVAEFLTRTTGKPNLPCGSTSIPIS